MAEPTKPYFQLFSDPMKYYNAMLDDIEKAVKYIYLEIYRFNYDFIGIRFRDALTRKSKQGVEIKLLLDSWGTSVPANFFAEIIKNGGEVRFFRKIVYTFDFFTRNHRRNHRKIMVIDDKTAYIGSGNLTAYSIPWRELFLKITGGIALQFKKSFQDSFKIYNKYIFNKFSFKKTIKYHGFEIIQDIPSIYRQHIKKKFENLIKSAHKELVIESPYFLPGFMIRKFLIDAVNRGVDVKVILPRNSDVRLIDILRRKYLGILSRNGVKILFYLPSNLHAKGILVDRKLFVVASANFDYRSFRYQHEIALLGRDPEIVKAFEEHVNDTLRDSESFNYENWLTRPFVDKFFEWLLVPFRHLF